MNSFSHLNIRLFLIIGILAFLAFCVQAEAEECFTDTCLDSSELVNQK